ncbi:AFR110Cp [Eremothecium gossypii ATCC 10895]|uniref:Phosphatidylethanolamine N-methyltransferase n=1 Tax=Eremothecium gossypii (strain ATCC 10895 / CBS 109.51 / FGSC 9923 / NRRL Y-1056) TaxID=284811 RepID=CHO2_EREGS|nr:AFR110Cp [Eremothecium gossypii ATCC 10895]Q754G0.1 RecName: Full=Phosphatidylethanolamine N-methyltransferase; Short=PE methyltransferase; Short=PEAMT; Short=PEMT [Eremothecium gossypii ATCC 10895]AAS53481.1 AFR110Cp [Eremothecium gossypii ATCC 10895]AEY97793.1 FAFR110Cp [Eremothecium gossypii FDAG1]
MTETKSGKAVAPAAQDSVAGTLAVCRSSGEEFRVPKTHDMLRSLFDPRLRKSFLELCITLSLVANCAFCYWSWRVMGGEWAMRMYLAQYLAWRLTYNLGIGLILHYQSHYEFLTEFAKRNGLFASGAASKSWLASFCQFEIASKMPREYDMAQYPTEFNVWLLFRQFVDLVLMQDFTTYVLYVLLSFSKSQVTWSLLQHLNWTSCRVYVGTLMLLLNVWVKMDAHRVVKDYAWYWGDFFFLLKDSNLIFDGVFNISPHPMYSIGYMGYYGVSLITGDYRVLLVSILGHFLQFLFLKYVETPHIERIYGPDQPSSIERVDDQIIKNNRNYTRPLMMTYFWFKNFDPLRPTDYFTVGTAAASISAILLNPKKETVFAITLFVKLVTSMVNFFILRRQSTDKWFTKLFLRNGYTQLYSYQMWQFIYNFNLMLSYVTLALQTWIQFQALSQHDYTNVIFGFILVALHIWADGEILNALTEFGWFYGDFFLTNYIQRPKLASHGIYRYLKNPECVLGVAGAWGTVLITDFSVENIILATIWTLSNHIMVTFVESPHVAKVYGNEMLARQSGVGKTLLGFTPIKHFSDWLDKFSGSLIDMLNVSTEGRDQLEDVIAAALQATTRKLSPDSEFEINRDSENNSDGDFSFTIGDSIEISWKLPRELYHDEDWIGLYRVLETGEDRYRTLVSSRDHWCATNTMGYPKSVKAIGAVKEFTKGDTCVQGRVVFDHNLLYFEKGVYEFRYHSTSGHKVLMISPPFKITVPQLDLDTPEALYQSTVKLLEKCHCLNENGRFEHSKNKYLSERTLQKLFRNSTGADISSDYMKRVNYEIREITERIYEMKKILDSLR